MLAEHTTLELDIYRMYVNVYVPMLQTGADMLCFFRKVRGNPVPSSALMEPMTRRFVVAIERYAEREGIDLVRFERFERKDDRTLAYLRNFTGTEEVLYIGKAQKKARQAVHQRPRVPQAPVGETGCRVRVAGQRHPELHRRGPHAAPGRRPDGGKGRHPAAQVAEFGRRALILR